MSEVSKSQQAQTPIIVVGAGLAGMAAALTLARAGLPVMILEACDQVGGCCSNTDIAGFTFNNGAVYVAVPSLLRASFERLGLDLDAEASLRKIDQPHQTYLEDGTVIQLSDAENSFVDGPDALRRTAMLREGLTALQRGWGPLYRTLVNEVLPFEPFLPRTLAKVWRYLPLMGGRVDRLIAKHFDDAGLRSAVASTLLYTGTAPERLPATQIIGLLALLQEGFYLPENGMGAIADALYRALQRHQVPMRLGASVDRIELTGGKVSGIWLVGGERICANQVVVTGSGFEVIERMLSNEAIPRSMRRLAKRAPLSHRAISIQLGVCGIPKKGAFMVNYVPPMSEQGQMHIAAPGIPRWLSYTQPSAVLPHLARQDQSIIELYAPVSGVEAASQWTRAMTEDTVGAYLQALTSRLPGLHIQARRVLDPQDFVRSRHLYEGALYGMAPGTPPHQLFPHSSAIQGLYMAGQTTYPGYGVPSVIVSGIQAAKALAQKAGAIPLQ